MKFKVEHTNNIEQRKLFYIPEDYAFDTEPSISEIDFDIVINQLILTVVDNRIVQVLGFCPYASWIKSTYDVPKYTQGVLRIINNLEPGFSYSIGKDDWPVYVNTKTGWICIGNPNKSGEAIEFMNNCVAVVHSNQLMSLWLKPQLLPDI